MCWAGSMTDPFPNAALGSVRSADRVSEPGSNPSCRQADVPPRSPPGARGSRSLAAGTLQGLAPPDLSLFWSGGIPANGTVALVLPVALGPCAQGDRSVGALGRSGATTGENAWGLMS
jgi:hypothetical protein